MFVGRAAATCPRPLIASRCERMLPKRNCRGRQSARGVAAMKTTLNLTNLWSVLALSLMLVGAVATYQSAAGPGNEPKFLITGGRPASSRRLPSPRAAGALPAVKSVQRQPNIQPDSSDVSVTCSASDFVLRVKPTFYGLFADKEELKLGDNCQSNGVLRPYDDLLFTYPLTACGSVRQVGPLFVSKQ